MAFFQSSLQFIALCPAMEQVVRFAAQIAKRPEPVLLLGETGVGKDQVARLIHDQSSRAEAKFVSLNCAALAPSLLENELFGHDKGAFTGADRDYEGLFEQANGGSLFLNEIGDTSLELQAKLLQAVETGRFRRVGGKADKTVDVRIIAATHRPLLEMAQDGKFREDLFYRLSVFPIAIPPLRERGEDILRIARQFLANDNGTFELSDDACRLLLDHFWPGNVRELRSVISRAEILASSDVTFPLTGGTRIEAEHVRFDASRSSLPSALGAAVLHVEHGMLHVDVPLLPGIESPELHARTLDQVEKALLTFVLNACGGNQSTTAAQLGITRGSLRNKMRELGITVHARVRNRRVS